MAHGQRGGRRRCEPPLRHVRRRLGRRSPVGLLGANGAGKTTLIRMLLGLLPPSAGRVVLFGQAPTRELRRRVGYVPQNLGLYRDLTGRENPQFRAAVFGVEPSAFGQEEATLIDALPLGLQRRPSTNVSSN